MMSPLWSEGPEGGYRLEFSSESFDSLFGIGFTRGRPLTDFQDESPVF